MSLTIQYGELLLRDGNHDQIFDIFHPDDVVQVAGLSLELTTQQALEMYTHLAKPLIIAKDEKSAKRIFESQNTKKILMGYAQGPVPINQSKAMTPKVGAALFVGAIGAGLYHVLTNKAVHLDNGLKTYRFDESVGDIIIIEIPKVDPDFEEDEDGNLPDFVPAHAILAGWDDEDIDGPVDNKKDIFQRIEEIIEREEGLEGALDKAAMYAGADPELAFAIAETVWEEAGMDGNKDLERKALKLMKEIQDEFPLASLGLLITRSTLDSIKDDLDKPKSKNPFKNLWSGFLRLFQ